MNDVLTGKEAQETLSAILSKDMATNQYPAPYVTGYYADGQVWVAFDNRDGCCWVEEFSTERKAKEYVR